MNKPLMKKILFVYPAFERHADAHPELREYVPCDEYLGSPSLGIASVAAMTPAGWTMEYRDDRVTPADTPTDADIVALSFFTPAATRALKLADYFRECGKTVVAGGIFPTMMPREVAPHVDAVVVGEGEGVWGQLLSDAVAGDLRPMYRGDLADLSSLPLPNVALYFGAETDTFQPDDYPLQLSRGCLLSCEACALPGTMGNQIRHFDIEQVIAQLEVLEAHGKNACLTEDTSWLPGLGRRRLVELLEFLVARGQRASVSYVGVSFPMLRTVSPKVLALAKSAGVDMFYLVTGFDPISKKAFGPGEERAKERAAEAIKRCWDAGIEPYTSFLIGNDEDDEGTADRMLEFCEETAILKAEFAIATPYPGTPRWHQLESAGRLLHRDWRRYNDANVVFQPAKLSPEQVQADYLRLWRDFYAGKEHLADIPERKMRAVQF